MGLKRITEKVKGLDSFSCSGGDGWVFTVQANIGRKDALPKFLELENWKSVHVTKDMQVDWLSCFKCLGRIHCEKPAVEIHGTNSGQGYLQRSSIHQDESLPVYAHCPAIGYFALIYEKM